MRYDNTSVYSQLAVKARRSPARRFSARSQLCCKHLFRSGTLPLCWKVCGIPQGSVFGPATVGLTPDEVVPVTSDPK